MFSFIGAMFAPRPDRIGAELIRVCRVGGRIVMGNWTPQGFVGQMSKLHGNHVPPPHNMVPPVLRGDETTVRDRLKRGIAMLRVTPRKCPFRYPFPPPKVVDVFRTRYGLSSRTFAALGPERQQSLKEDLARLWSEYNQTTDETTCVVAEYLEVVSLRG